MRNAFPMVMRLFYRENAKCVSVAYFDVERGELESTTVNYKISAE